MLQPNYAKTSAILCITPTRIGDAVLSTCLLQEAIKRHPTAQVDVISNNLSADIFAGIPNLRNLWRIDKRRYSLHWLTMWRLCVNKRYSLVVDMRGSALSYCLRTKKRWVFRGNDAPVSKYVQFCNFLNAKNIALPTVWASAADTVVANNLCGSSQFIAFAPIANWPPKEWLLDNFIALAHTLQEQFPAVRPMLICAPHERDRMAPMIDALSRYNPLVLCDSALTLPQIYACIGRAQMFVGNDSGLMHMAAASGITTLGLFGPTNAAIYRPVGRQAHYMVADGQDLSHLTVAAVIEKLRTLPHSAP